MSARPGDWSLLNLSGDPLPGDELAVSSQATHYQSVADTISDQITSLRQISNGDAKGLYVDKLADDAKDIADELSKVQDRFETVATQLKVWQPVLAEGRTKSASLLEQAQTAHQTMTANQPPSTPLPDDATDAQVAAEHSRSQSYSTAQGQLSGYVTAMGHELDHVRSVAKKVAGKIEDAADDDVKDSWWDRHVRKWIQDHAHLIEIIVKVLEIAAIVIAVAALVLATGGFGAFALLGVGAEALATMGAIASTLEVVGAVASGAMLLAHGAEMNAGVNGVGWGDIGLDLFALATFGAGRYFSSAAKAATTLGESGATREVSEAAARGLAPNVKNALQIGSDTNPLRVWAAGQRTAAIESATSSLKASLEVSPSLSSTLLNGSREAAETAAKLRTLAAYPSASAAVQRGLALSHAGMGLSLVDRLHLGDDIVKQLRELTGGEESEGGE